MKLFKRTTNSLLAIINDLFLSAHLALQLVRSVVSPIAFAVFVRRLRGRRVVVAAAQRGAIVDVFALSPDRRDASVPAGVARVGRRVQKHQLLLRLVLARVVDVVGGFHLDGGVVELLQFLRHFGERFQASPANFVSAGT